MHRVSETKEQHKKAYTHSTWNDELFRRSNRHAILPVLGFVHNTYIKTKIASQRKKTKPKRLKFHRRIEHAMQFFSSCVFIRMRLSRLNQT